MYVVASLLTCFVQVRHLVTLFSVLPHFDLVVFRVWIYLRIAVHLKRLRALMQNIVFRSDHRMTTYSSRPHFMANLSVGSTRWETWYRNYFLWCIQELLFQSQDALFQAVQQSFGLLQIARGKRIMKSEIGRTNFLLLPLLCRHIFIFWIG